MSKIWKMIEKTPNATEDNNCRMSTSLLAKPSLSKFSKEFKMPKCISPTKLPKLDTQAANKN